MTARSYLYVPGTAGDRLRRARTRGADAIIVDLEDAVVVTRKDEARIAAAAFVGAADETVETWVRINQRTAGLIDVSAVAGPGLTGICLAKTAGPDEVGAVDAALTAAETAVGMSIGSVAINPLIESAEGLENLRAIARSPRVRMIQIGEADLTADLGLHPAADGVELLAIRTAVVVASRAAGIAAPIAAVSTEFRDLDAFRADTERHHRLGFRGRACIHPAQVAVVHDVFTPTADEVDRARTIIALFDDAVARGDGALVDQDGRMLDEALVRSARSILALARH